MPFTPTSVYETNRIRSVKKAAASELADYFFTYAFAYILCVLPGFCIYVLTHAVAVFLGANIFQFVFPPLVYTLGFKGFYAFVKTFHGSGKRNFYVIADSAFNKALIYLRNAAILLLVSFLPALIIYFLPFLLHADRTFHLVCEILSIAAGLFGLCLFMSEAVFKSHELKYLKLISSFAFQIALSILTKGVWLIIFIPHLLLSSLIYSNTK